VLTRLEEPKKHNLSVLQKLKLYNGKTLPTSPRTTSRSCARRPPRGLEGISPRYIQDKISNALVSDKGEGCINPFMVLNELEAGLKGHSLISTRSAEALRELLTTVKQEYEDIVKNEVQRAISADEDAIGKLCGNYIDNIKAYTQKEKVRNKYTGLYEEPDERLMRASRRRSTSPRAARTTSAGRS
jgi:serine protein kinase